MDPNLNSLIAQSKQKLDEGGDAAGANLQDLIAQTRAKIEAAPPPPARVEKPDERPWYERLGNRIMDDFASPTAAYDRAAHGVESDPEWQAQGNEVAKAADELGTEARHIQSSPAEVAKFAGRTALGTAGQFAGGVLGTAQAASPIIRTGLGAAAGGVAGGANALAHGASPSDAWDATLHGAGWGAALTGAGEAIGAKAHEWGAANKNAANEKLATTAMPGRELDRIRTRGGDEGVAKAGQALRDAGATSSQGLDRLSKLTPQVMSRNVTREMNAANQSRETAEDAILNTPAGGQTVGRTNVNMTPVQQKMTQEANRLRYEKASPEGPAAYEVVRDRFTTPANPKGPPERFPQPTPDAGDVGLPPPPAPDAGQGELIFPQPAPYPRSPVPENQTALPLGRGVKPAVQEPLPLPPGERPPPQLPPEPEQMPLGLSRAEPQQQDFGFPSPPRQMTMATNESAPRARPDSFGATGGPQMGLDFNAPEGQMCLPLSRPASPPPGDEGLPANYPQRPPMSQTELPLPGQQSLPFPPGDENLLASAPSSVPEGQQPLPFGRQRSAPSQLPLEFSRNEQQLELPLEGQQGITFPQQPAPAEAPAPGPAPEQTELPFDKQGPAPVQRNIPYDQPPGTQMDLPLPGQQSLPFPPRAPGPEQDLLNSPISNDQLPMYYGGYNPPGTANAAQPAGPIAPRAPMPEQQSLPLEEHPRTGYTLEELVASTRRAGKEASPSFHGGSKLNKAPTYSTEAQGAVYGSGKDLVNSELDKAIENGYANPDDVAARAAANKKFSTLATVAPNVAKQANQANRAALKPSSSDKSWLGLASKGAGELKDRALGINSQYALGQGLEGVGTAAQAGSDLARMGAGLGWNQNRQDHPEIAKAQQDNPQAPKAEVEQKANDSMKDKLMGAWYNVLGAFHQ